MQSSHRPKSRENSTGILIQQNYVDSTIKTPSQTTLDLMNKHRRNSKTMTNPLYLSPPMTSSDSRKIRHQTLNSSKYLVTSPEPQDRTMFVRSLSPPSNNNSLLKITKALSPNPSRGQTTIHLNRKKREAIPQITLSDFNKTITSSDSKVSSTFMSPRTMGTHYNYYNQHLTFIPQDLSSSVMNKTSFSGFNDLARRVNSVNQSALGSLVLEDSKRKNSDGEPIKQVNGLGTLQKSLAFNKQQKDAYEVEIYRQQKEVIMPLVTQEKTDLQKKKKIGIIKVAPSKSLYTQAAWEALIQRNTSFQPLKDTETDDQSKEEKEEKINKKLDDYEAKAHYRKFKYKFFWYFLDNNLKSWAPESREGQTLTSVGKCVLMYGGISNDCKNDIAIFYPGRNVWKKLPMQGDVPMTGRHGHSACVYNKNTILFFGGEGGFSTELQYRECLSDVRAYNIERYEWKYFKCSSRDETISGRRNHSAAIFDKFMYVYGGISVEGNYLDELWALNLKNFNWYKLPVAGNKAGPIAFHTMTPCFFDRNNPQNLKSKMKNKAMEEGFYVFGGKDETGRAINTLQFLDPNSKDLCWKYPVTKGEPPCARFNHTAIFYEELSILIIYGGKNENYYESNTYLQFHDIKVLNLETMTWNPTLSVGECPKVPRMGHAAALYGSAMVIFGGLGVREFMPSQARMVELGQSNVQRLIEESQERRDSLQVRRTTVLVNVEDEEEENNKSPKSPLKNQARSPLFSKLAVKASLFRSDTKQSFLAVPQKNKETQMKKDAKALNIIEAWKKLTTNSIGGGFHRDHSIN